MLETVRNAPRAVPAGRSAAGITLAVASATTLVVLMAYSAPATTLPQISADLGTGPTGQTWILNGVPLGLAAALLSAGSLADDRGRRKVFAWGAALLTLSLLAAALATGTGVLVGARVVQGVASAALLAASLGMVGHAFPSGPARVRATALWGAMIGAGLLVGPLLSGELAEVWNWRAIYWLMTAAGVLVTVAACTLLPESRSASPRPVDLPGAVTLGAGLTALLAAVTMGRSGWDRWQIWALFAAAAAGLAGFTLAETRARTPMLDLGLLRRPAFLVSVVGALVVGLAIIGPLSFQPTLLHAVHGFSPLTTGAITAIWTGASVPAALLGARLPLSGRGQLVLGLLVGMVGELVMLGYAHTWSWPRETVALAIIGIGSGLGNAALARLAVESVPADRVSMGSGANNTARYIGGSLGVAAVIAILGGAHTLAAGADIIIWISALLSLAGAALALTLRERPAAAGRQPVRVGGRD